MVATAGTIGGIYAYLSPEGQPPQLASTGSIRQLISGEIIGIRGNNEVHAWLGIPYANPPLGELRWKAPRLVEPWQERKEVLAIANRCTQLPIIPGDPGPIGSEDCLYLNVWSPIYAEDNVPVGDSALPVMFWIHGGANTIGQGGTSIYDGSLLAIKHNVIVVTINYRLGPLGWFTHPGLRGADTTPEDRSGNYGTLDIIAALKWVQANIAVFGGDPGNVTIFGESAGGWNVLTMMASPLAEGLFHRAISQSGGLTIASPGSAENYQDDDNPGDQNSSREVINRLMLNDGSADSQKSARIIQSGMPAEELAAWLRMKTPEELFTAYSKVFTSFIMSPNIFGDGYVLPADMQAEKIFSDTKYYNQVSVILGTNRDEAKLFMMWNDQLVDKIAGFPSGIKDLDVYNREAAYTSNLWKAAAVDELARLMRDAQGDSVYTYRFDADDWRNLGIVDYKDLLGAAHAMELMFVFGNFPNPMRIVFPGSTFDELKLLSNSMMSYWAEFAHTGAPGSGRTGKEILWSGWQNDGDQTPRILILDTKLDHGIRMSSEQLTVQDVKQAFLSDTSYGSQKAHCDAYKRMFSWSNNFDEQEYRSLGASGCQD